MANNGAGAHVWVDDFMPVVAQRIVDRIPGLTRDKVFQSVWSEADHLRWPPDDRFVALYAHRFPVDQTDVTGGGELNTAFDAGVRATAFVRVESDIENRSGQFMEDQVRAVTLFAQQVITALHMFDPDNPFNSAGLKMFRWPMRVVPDWTIQPMSGANGSRWGVVPMNFVCSYVADLGVGFDGLPLVSGY